MQAKYIFIFLLLLLATFCSKAQSVTPQVLPGNGGYYQAGSTGLSWTLGQPVATTFSAGSLILTWGYQQPEVPLKPVTPTAQRFCADTAHTFTFSSVTAGDIGNQIEWATDSNFTHTHILTSPATFSILVASGADSVIWIRSRDSTTWMVSVAVSTHAKNYALPINAVYYNADSLIPRDSSTRIIITNAQSGVHYYLRIHTVVIDSAIATSDSVILNTGRLDTITVFNVLAVNNTTGCSKQVADSIIIHLFLTQEILNQTFSNLVNQSDPNYYTIVDSIDKVTKILDDAEHSGITIIESEGFDEMYNYFKYFWENKVSLADSNPGSFLPARGFYKSLAANSITLSDDCLSPPWVFEGPKSDPTTVIDDWYCSSNNIMQQQAFINSLWVNPQNKKDKIAIALQTGLWRTDPSCSSSSSSTEDDCNWINISKSASIYGQMFQLQQFSVNPDNANFIYAASIFPPFLFYTTNGGDSWTADDGLVTGSVPLMPTNISGSFTYPYTHVIDNIKFSPDGKYLFVLGQQNVYRKVINPTDSWINIWDLATTTESVEYDDITFDPLNSNNIFIGRKDYYQDQSLRPANNLFFSGSEGDVGSWHVVGNFGSLSSPNTLPVSNYSVAKVSMPTDGSTEIYALVGNNINFFRATFWIYKASMNDAPNFNWTLLNNGTLFYDDAPYFAIAMDDITFIASNSKHTSGTSQNRLFYFTNTQLCYSDDLGATIKYGAFNGDYSDCEKHADIRCLTLFSSDAAQPDGAGDFLYLGSDGGVSKREPASGVDVYTTASSNSVFKNLNNSGIIGTRLTQMDFDPLNPKTIVYSAIHHGLQITVNGTTWKHQQGGDGANATVAYNSTSPVVLFRDKFNNLPLSAIDINTQAIITPTGLSTTDYTYSSGTLPIQVYPDGTIYSGWHNLLRGTFASNSLNLSNVSSNSSNLTNYYSYDYVFNPSDFSVDATNRVGHVNAHQANSSSSPCGCLNSAAVTPSVNGSGYICYCFDPGAIQAFDVNEADDQTIYIAQKGPYGIDELGVARSDNGGDNWYNVTSNLVTGDQPWSNYPIADIKSDPNYSNKAWLAFGGFPYDADGTLRSSTYRVMRTVDGGSSWCNVSDGLPPVPVNKLLVFKYNTDLVFAATDMGVYMYQAATGDDCGGTWLCLNNGISPLPVVDLKLDYCRMKLYAGTSGFGIWSWDIADDLIKFNSVTINGSSPGLNTSDNSVTWNNVHEREKGNITIESGYTLKITNGSEIDMPRTANIIVNPGAKLLVDNSTLTNDCSAMWDGIIVKGQKLLSQDLSTTDDATAMSTNQGFVYLNGATIENAYEALRVWDLSAGWVSGDRYSAQGGTGGIIRAYKTKFKNVRRAAEFMWYKHFSSSNVEELNKSFFSYCVFTTDNQHSDEHPFNSFVTMWGTTGVKFTACNFENNDDRVTDAAILGTGIGSIDASYTTQHGILTVALSTYTDRNTFKNLAKGIDVENSSSTGAVNIYDADFTDNQAGALLVNSNGSNVNGNRFTVGHLRNSITPSGTFYGAGFDHSSGFQHTLNKFNSDNCSTVTTVCDAATIGSGFLSTSTTANNISESNTYSNIKFASLANEVNRSSDGIFGLQFQCNANDNDPDTHYDYTVFQDYLINDDGIKDHQGDNSAPPANIFSTPATTNKNQFRNYAWQPVIYHWFTSGEMPNINNILNVTIPGRSLGDATCPANNTGNGGHGNLIGDLSPTDFSNMKTDFGTAYTKYTNVQARLESLIDGGHSGSLKSLVAGADTTNADSIKTVLHSIAPFVSERVLRAFAGRDDIYDLDTIYNVIYENRNAAETNNLPGYLKLKKISTAKIDTLRSHIADSTARYMLEDSVAHYAEQYSSLGRDIIMYIQNDSTGFDHAQYRYWLAKLHDAEADYMRIEDFMDLGIMDTALMELDSVPVRYSLSNLQDSAYQTFRKLVSFKKSVIDDSISISHLDTLHGIVLDSIARLGSGLAARKAQSIMRFFYNGPYDTRFEIPADSAIYTYKTDGKDVTENKKTISVNNGYIIAYPNPTNGNETFDFKLPCEQQDGLLIIADMTGHAMYNGVTKNGDTRKTIETKAWGNGVYLYRLTCGDKLVGSGRFEVLR